MQRELKAAGDAEVTTAAAQAPEESLGSLRRAEPEPVPDVSFDLWVQHHPAILRVSRIRLFAEFISDTIRSDLDLLEGRPPL